MQRHIGPAILQVPHLVSTAVSLHLANPFCLSLEALFLSVWSAALFIQPQGNIVLPAST